MRKRRRSPSTTPPLSPEQSAARGKELLCQGDYRQAVTCFKQLAKREGGNQWDGFLAQAYLGRSGELAAKSMFKEAVILWENAARLLPETPPPNRPLVWLANTHQYGEAIRLFCKHEAWIEKHDSALWDTFGALLAALLVTDAPGVREALPDQSPLLSYNETATAALAAYCRGDDAAADDCLRRIPLRSPFKSFRLILKSLLLQQHEPDKAARLLDKIPPESPFFGLASIARIGTLAGIDLVNALMALPTHQQAFAGEMLEIDENHLALFGQLTTPQKGSQLLRRLTDNAAKFPTEEVRLLCRDILINHPREMARYETQFGKLDIFDVHRCAALGAEEENRFSQAHDRWMRGIEQLETAPKQGDNALKIALIHRHLAERDKKSSGTATTHAVHHLEESLSYDPGDRATWLQVIQWHREVDNLKLYHQWADKAYKRFPDDNDVLTVAMESALKKNAFVKASRLAKKVLERDPINSRVRQQMVEAHLSHAWKKVGEAKPHLVQKEIAAALSLERGDSGDQRIQIHQGLLALRMGNTAEGKAFLQEAEVATDPGIIFPLRVLLEANDREMSRTHLKQFRNKLASHNDKSPLTAQVVAAAGIVTQCASDGEDPNDELFSLLPEYFRKAARLKYTVDELRLVCTVLDDTDQFKLLKLFGQAGEKQWPDHPVFLFYRVCGQTRRGSTRVSADDSRKLMAAQEQARKIHDLETVERIEDLLTPVFTPGMMPGSFPFPQPSQLPKFVEQEMIQQLRQILEQDFGEFRNKEDRLLLKEVLMESLDDDGVPDFGVSIMTDIIDQVLDLHLEPKTPKRAGGRFKGGRTLLELLESELFK